VDIRGRGCGTGCSSEMNWSWRMPGAGERKVSEKVASTDIPNLRPGKQHSVLPSD
jgi:hypothetical protein